VANLGAAAAQIETARSLPPRFESVIQRILGRVWVNGIELSAPKA
jgi:hypothetical protein